MEPLSLKIVSNKVVELFSKRALRKSDKKWRKCALCKKIPRDFYVKVEIDMYYGNKFVGRNNQYFHNNDVCLNTYILARMDKIRV